MSTRLEILPLEGFPLVVPGDDLGGLIVDCLKRNGIAPQPGDLLAIAQKVVSKAEDRYVRLADVVAGEQAQALARETDKNPRQVEVILREAHCVVRSRPGVIVVEHRLGYVHANAGIDKSNLPQGDGQAELLLLPEDPDGSALQLLEVMQRAYGFTLPILINDSTGRAWRMGTVGIAIGTAGFDPLRNQVGEADLFGRELEVTEVAVADELAAAASLVMGQAAEACPVVLLRGANWRPAQCGSGSLIRPRDMDMFR